jgi:hypothetical protein
MPVASDMPMIEPILVEVSNPAHPYGAKGVGEYRAADGGDRQCDPPAAHRIADVAAQGARGPRPAPGGLPKRKAAEADTDNHAIAIVAL